MYPVGAIKLDPDEYAATSTQLNKDGLLRLRHLLMRKKHDCVRTRRKQFPGSVLCPSRRDTIYRSFRHFSLHLWRAIWRTQSVATLPYHLVCRSARWLRIPLTAFYIAPCIGRASILPHCNSYDFPTRLSIDWKANRSRNRVSCYSPCHCSAMAPLPVWGIFWISTIA